MSPTPSSTTRGNPSTQHKPPPNYDFTKRKRWADLLAAELVETIIFVLTPATKVIYCGSAVNEVLGWREGDFLDCDLIEFINVEDQHTFRADLDECLRTQGDLLTYARIKPNTTLNIYPPIEEATYEFRGYVHALPEEPDKGCLIVMAKQYFFRHTMLINSLTELRIENQRLQERVQELRRQAPSQLVAEIAASGASDVANPFYSSSSLAPRPQDNNPVDLSEYSGNPSTMRVNAAPSQPDEDQAEDGSKKKKFKKSHGTEQYVCITCGRTDSPEWRKGPLGPKTLCNACGLRWAKQSKRNEEARDGSAVAKGSDDGTSC